MERESAREHAWQEKTIEVEMEKEGGQVAVRILNIIWSSKRLSLICRVFGL